MVGNRKMFGTMLAGVDHLPHTYNRKEQAFTKGEPDYGMHYADELERLVALHDASTIAAVIVEPMAGSTGVLPPPKGYLKRLREICDKHGILLIFDEVITGFGRLGYAFAAERLACSLHDHLCQCVPRHRADGRRMVRRGILIRSNGPDHALNCSMAILFRPSHCSGCWRSTMTFTARELFENAKSLGGGRAALSLKINP